MKEKDIRDAWARIRTIDQTIPDNVLDFMKDAAIAALSQPAPQPVSVIVPPIEWEPKSGCAINSKCGKYSVRGYPFGDASAYYEENPRTSQRLSNTKAAPEVAMQICQDHNKERVLKALQGCNVQPYRDPKGLVDLIRRWVELDDFSRTIPIGVEFDLPEQQCPDNWESISRESKSILKAWEDGK